MDEIKNCLDTYALVEIKLGNPKFMKYFRAKFVITDLTLAEFYSVLLREEKEETADYWIKKFENYSVPVKKKILLEAVKFRRKNNKTNISFFDAVGYVFSIENKYSFVTGDKEFEKFKGVEFRKK
ncbi:MAG: type II toxin-antitoxin system VapC family toxin [Candidatus Nanoarchaeia archaeon]